MIRWNASVLPWCGVAESSSRYGAACREAFAEAVAGDLFGAAAEPVGLVDDNQIPTGGDQVAEAFLVVLVDLLLVQPRRRRSA